ncbi:hypothetical protein ABPG74_013056 [Tetrahymena malaccensis]
MKLIALLLLIVLITVNAADQVPQCAKDLQAKLDQNTVCTEGDTDCIASLKSFKECIVGCGMQYPDSDKDISSCISSQCTTSNTTVQNFKNDILKCINSSLIVAFTMLFALIFLIF